MKRLLLYVLSVCMIICLFACGKEEKPSVTTGPSDDGDPGKIVIADKGVCDYTIVMPESSFGKVRTAVSDVQTLLEDLSGDKVAMIKGSEGNFEEEIIFGDTVRPETAQAKELLGDNDYIMTVIGKKLVLLGKNDECLSYLSTRIIEFIKGNRFEVPADLCQTGKVGEPHYVEEVKADNKTAVEFDFMLLSPKSELSVFFGNTDRTAINGINGFSVVITGNKVVFNRQGVKITEYANKKMTVSSRTEYKCRFEFIDNYCRFYLIDDLDGFEPWPEFELNIGSPVKEASIGYAENNGYGVKVGGFVSSAYELEEPTDGTYKNALIADGADPDVIEADGVYYLFTTGGGYPCYTSTNLVDWKRVGQALPNYGWGVSGKNYWAPDVEYINGRYYMAVSFGEEGFGIASSRNPLGPYVCQGDKSLLKTTIDGHLFVDDDGTVYLFYTSWYNGRSYGIYGVQMEFEGSNLVPVWDTEQKLLSATLDWEREDDMGPVIEAPFMLKHNGKYYLVYSATHTGSIHYAVGYAVSDYPLKSFKKYENNPILHMTSDVHCTGHCTIVNAPDGSMCILYHCSKDLNSIYPRRTCIDRIRFSPTPSGVDRLEVYGPTSMRQNIDWMGD
ncbi:MAG: glycoside hydrolase family 43 protein [Clostridia bacterium]|nr:glycoside hydrolase family 43 protein [Clostridia bacterium]